jgi:hypothetical protein
VFFILRALFWFGVVLLLLPAVTPHGQQAGAPTPVANRSNIASQAATAAAGYCTANPEKCLAGLQAARHLGTAAQGSFDAAQAEPVSAKPRAAPTKHIVLPPPRPVLP